MNIFNICVSATNDTFWKQLLTLASTGNLPNHFHIENGKLVYKHKDKYAELTYVNSCEALIDFFKQTGSIYSADDVQSKSNISNDNWNAVVKNGVALDSILHTYTSNLCKSLSLPENLRQHLHLVLSYGVKSGLINNVTFSNGSIKDIPQLSYDNSNKFNITTSATHGHPIYSVSRRTRNKPTPAKRWNTFVSNIDKK